MVDTAVEDLAFQRQFEQAQAAAANITEPRAIVAYYDTSAALVVVRLRSGASFSFPPSIAQGLSGAEAKDLAQVEITPMGGWLALGNVGYGFYGGGVVVWGVWDKAVDGDASGAMVAAVGLLITDGLHDRRSSGQSGQATL